MIAAFGARAERYAQGLGGIDAIVVDPGQLGLAYHEAVNRRVAGTPFYVMLLYDDQRCALAGTLAAEILAQASDHDQRLGAFRALGDGSMEVNGRKIGEMWAEVASEMTVLAPELLALADGWLVRSYLEYQRIAKLGLRPRPVERILVEPPLPPIGERHPTPSVVVWAPRRNATAVALEAFALTEFVGPVTVVCAGGTLETLSTLRFITPDDPACAAALGAAGVVVCPDLGDPGDAAALARAGLTVVAPVTSGAAEFVGSLSTYDAASSRSLWDAVAVALGRPGNTVVPVVAPAPAPAVPALPRESADVPLVSLVIPTYNRRLDLGWLLSDLQRQTYPNIEIVIVNDAGENIDDVAAPYQNARVVNQEVNGGTIRAAMAGMRAARGEYFQFLADDDCLYPDHLQRLIGAMLRYDAGAAHGNTLIRFQEPRPEGGWFTVGYNARAFNATTFPSAALISTPIAGQSLVVRRDVFDRVGGAWREDCLLADQEFQFRLWPQTPIIWIDQITAEWRIRGSENISARFRSAGEMRRVYEELVPVSGRPMIAALRAQTLVNLEQRPEGFTYPVTLRIQVTP